MTDAEYEDLVDAIDAALREDGWLGHTEELEAWHINAIANAAAKAVRRGQESIGGDHDD